MVLVAAVASFAILTTCYSHFHQHFQLVLCALPPGLFKQSSAAADHVAALYRTRSASRSRSRRCCSLMARDDENFDFFPHAFWVYLCLQYILALLVVAVEIVHFASAETHESSESLVELVLGNPLRTHDRDSLRHIHDLNHHSTASRMAVAAVAIDYVLVYCLLLSCLFESFFSFFRYRSTLVTSATLGVESVSAILRRFSVYGVVFVLLYALTVHWHYLVCLPLVLLYMTFNLYCTYQFCAILIDRFRFMIQHDTAVQTVHYTASANERVLDSIYFIRRTSLSVCVMQCVSLALFVFMFNANAIYFLPVLWAVSSLVFSLNFIRNRRHLERQRMRCQFWCQFWCRMRCTLLTRSSTALRVKRAPAPAPACPEHGAIEEQKQTSPDFGVEDENANEYQDEKETSSVPNLIDRLKRKGTHSASPLSKADSLRGTMATANHLMAPLTLSPQLPVLRDSESEKLSTKTANVLLKMKQHKQSRSANALSLQHPFGLPGLQSAKSDPVSVGKNKSVRAARMRKLHSRSNADQAPPPPPRATKVALSPSPIRTKHHGRPKAFDLLGITPTHSATKRPDFPDFMVRARPESPSKQSSDSHQSSKPVPTLKMQSSLTKLRGMMRADSAPDADNERYVNMDDGDDDDGDGDGLNLFSAHDLDDDVVEIDDAIDKAFQSRPALKHTKSNSAPDNLNLSQSVQLQQTMAMTHFGRLRNLGFINQQSLRSIQQLQLYQIKQQEKAKAKPTLDSIDWNALQPHQERPSLAGASVRSTPTPAAARVSQVQVEDPESRFDVPAAALDASRKFSFFGLGAKRAFSKSHTDRT